MVGYDKQVEAVAYDNPIPGYKTTNTINLRLWAAKPSGEFDLVRSSLKLLNPSYLTMLDCMLHGVTLKLVCAS